MNILFAVFLLHSLVLAESYRNRDAKGNTQRIMNEWPQLPRYYHLPPLREQAEIQDEWTAERRASVPLLLRKYGVDAWLVCNSQSPVETVTSMDHPGPIDQTEHHNCTRIVLTNPNQISQREYAEETVFWSLKSARQFSARRRTLILFLANPARQDSPTSYTWIDNTPTLWHELRGVLEKHGLERIAINTHPEIAFASGMHAGELNAISEGLGRQWTDKFVSEPMLAVEYIATMPQGRAIWYRRLQSTAWAMISEAFSERVIEPGKTTTTVRHSRICVRILSGAAD
jgi:hypothetical protein